MISKKERKEMEESDEDSKDRKEKEVFLEEEYNINDYKEDFTDQSFEDKDDEDVVVVEGSYDQGYEF